MVQLKCRMQGCVCASACTLLGTASKHVGERQGRTSSRGCTPCARSCWRYCSPVASAPNMPTKLQPMLPPEILARPFMTLAALPPGILHAWACSMLLE